MARATLGTMPLLGGLVSGAVTALAFPHWGLWPLGWVGLVPLLISLEGQRPQEGALVGWTSGILHFGLILYWLVDTMQVYGRLPLLASVVVMLLLVIYLGGFWGLFAWTVCVGRQWGIPHCISTPFVWVCIEGLRGNLLSGFPWALLGYSQWEVRSLIQVADLVGIYGLSFMLMMANGSLACLLSSFLMKGPKRALSILTISLTGVAVAIVLIYGNQKIKELETVWNQSSKIRVGIVQGNVAQTMKWELSIQEATLAAYLQGTRELVEKDGAAMVVWPETAVPFFFQREGPLRDRMIQEIAALKVEVLFGAPAYGLEEGKRVFYNRAYLLGKGGEILGHYDKTHLVPFGEYLPLQELMPFLRDMVTAIGDFLPGRDLRPLESSYGSKIGVSICFESIFPNIFRKQAQLGADLFANLTNDAWFGMTAAPYQHLCMLVLRAVENRRAIVRAANTGISAFVDPTGKVALQSNLFEPALLVDSIAPLKVNSFYTVHGDFVFWGSIAILMGLLTTARVREKRRKDVIA